MICWKYHGILFCPARTFGIPMETLPTIRSSSEIVGVIAEGPLQGVPISGVCPFNIPYLFYFNPPPQGYVEKLNFTI